MKKYEIQKRLMEIGHRRTNIENNASRRAYTQEELEEDEALENEARELEEELKIIEKEEQEER